MSGNQIKVTWEVEDGYAGQSRPQYTYIERADWESCETDQERDDLVDECVQGDFENNITWAVGEVES